MEAKNLNRKPLKNRKGVQDVPVWKVPGANLRLSAGTFKEQPERNWALLKLQSLLKGIVLRYQLHTPPHSGKNKPS